MELIDSRRLTGPNLVWDHPGAVLEVSFDDDRVVDLWKEEIVALRAALNLPDMGLKTLRTREGAWLVVGGPIDQLYGLIEASELAWSRATSRYRGEALKPADLDSVLPELSDERNAAVVALEKAASERHVTFLWDDDEVSLGMGSGSQSWPRAKTPDPAELDWSTYHDIPLALVTGTNGKSTNVRLLSHIASCWGKTYGCSSTDWIRVNEDVLDAGDYSGPGGARAVLRDTRVEIALLETARGGLLRRGCGVQRADVAAVLNVAEDHMGQYGINSVDDLIAAKLIVQRVVGDGGLLVLNADDARLVKAARKYPEQRTSWFSLGRESPVSGESHCFVEDGRIILSHHGVEHEIAALDDIPITLGGRAAYNVANALSSVLIAHGLGIPIDAIRKGLCTFQSDFESNPGRSNYFGLDGVTVLLDYAHNVHGLKAILETTANLGAKRQVLTLSTAGDRTEQEIRHLASTAVEYGIEKIYVSDSVGYERELGEGGVREILADELRRLGRSPIEVDSEYAAVKDALDNAEQGDLLICLVKADREEALGEIKARMIS